MVLNFRLVPTAVALALCVQCIAAQTPPVPLPANVPVLSASEQAKLDPLLLEVDIPKLHALYAAHKATRASPATTASTATLCAFTDHTVFVRQNVFHRKD